MKKKLLVVLIILFICVSGVIIFLNYDKIVNKEYSKSTIKDSIKYLSPDEAEYSWNISADPVKDEVYAYLYEDGTLQITGTGMMKNVIVNTIDWNSVKNEIKTVIIEEGVTNIGNSIFYQTSNLESVEISDTVTTIGANAFQECSKLKEVKISKNVTNIGESAFWGCTSLTEIIIPDKLEII